MENRTELRLRYIGTILDNAQCENSKKINENSKLKWNEIDSFSQNLMKAHTVNIIKELDQRKLLLKGEYSKFKSIENNSKKLKALHLYMNIGIITILLKYVDIIERVKFGSIFSFKTAPIFFISSLSSFYYANKYFTKYKTCSMFSNYCELTDQDPKKLLKKIKSDSFQKNKEERAIKNNLAKYWKEPMAWH
jgi:hypothetical protein